MAEQSDPKRDGEEDPLLHGHAEEEAVAEREKVRRRWCHPHGDAVAHAEHFREVAGDQQHGETFLCEAANDLVNFALRADLHALRRLRRG